MQPRSAVDVQEQSCAPAGKELRAPSFSRQCTLCALLPVLGARFVSCAFFFFLHSLCSGLSTIGAHFVYHIWRRSVLGVVGSILLFGSSHTDFCFASEALLGCSSVRETLKIVQVLSFLLSREECAFHVVFCNHVMGRQGPYCVRAYLYFFLFSLFFLSKWLKKLTVLQCVTISGTDSRQEIKLSLSSEL